MSNTEADPDEYDSGTDVPCEGFELLSPREVPLGGPRAMTVRRTLPQRSRSLIGAWCFVDHYGPDDVGRTGGMEVPRHPHTGLQTVSWLFTGEIEHRDSAGTHAMVRPGELNLMTAGHGISHSEYSTAGTTSLHGVQLWTALPDSRRDDPPRFDHHRPDAVTGDGWEARVFLGSFAGSTSPVPTATPLLGVELQLEPGATATFAVDPDFEHGLLVDAGPLTIAGDQPVAPAHLAYLPPGYDTLTLTTAESPARALLLGGPPFEEDIVMWWNFIGRTHDEIVEYRRQWQAEIGADEGEGGSADSAREPGDSPRLRFGRFPPDQPAPLPAPALPNARLRPRKRAAR